MSLDRLNDKVRTFLLKVPSHDCIVVVPVFLYPCHENAAKNSSWNISGVKQLFKTTSSYIKFCKVSTLSVCGAFYFHDAIAELSHPSAMENNTVQCCRYATVLYSRHAADFSLPFEQSTWFEHLMQSSAIYWNFE